jgi:hypothetical protein
MEADDNSVLIAGELQGRHNIRHNYTQHNGIQHNDTPHNDIQHNDTQHRGLFVTISISDSQHK